MEISRGKRLDVLLWPAGMGLDSKRGKIALNGSMRQLIPSPHPSFLASLGL
jgi:hypothetical protein